MILDFNTTEQNNVPVNSEIPSNGQLDAILGNMKPLINILQDETNLVNSLGNFKLVRYKNITLTKLICL